MLNWLQLYGAIVLFFVQITFYVVVAFSAIWAAVTFARYVKYMMFDEAMLAADELEEDEEYEDFENGDEDEEDDEENDEDAKPVEEFVE